MKQHKRTGSCINAIKCLSSSLFSGFHFKAWSFATLVIRFGFSEIVWTWINVRSHQPEEDSNAREIKMTELSIASNCLFAYYCLHVEHWHMSSAAPAWNRLKLRAQEVSLLRLPPVHTISKLKTELVKIQSETNLLNSHEHCSLLECCHTYFMPSLLQDYVKF